jgi:excisionase family DNA binding protein
VKPPAQRSSWLSPPQIAEVLGVDASKVLAWLKRGELVGVNLAESATGRPRWRISQEALDRFLAARQSHAPQPKVTRRRKRSAQVIEFF